MASEAPQPDPIRFVVTVVSTDPPTACDVEAQPIPHGWRFCCRPEDGAPFEAEVASPGGPILTWLEQAALAPALTE